MIDAMIRRVPLAGYRPLRQVVLDLPRRHPVRVAVTLEMGLPTCRQALDEGLETPCIP